MKPMYQGQIDVFCAAYAVINAMRHMRAIRLLACRELFHEALIDLARDEVNFRNALYQQTDYLEWVDSMLKRQERSGGIRVEHPFPFVSDVQVTQGTREPLSEPFSVPLDTLWTTFANWFAGGKRRAILFQFVRNIIPGDTQIRHWTCCCQMEDDVLRLYDSSLDSGAIRHIERDWLITEEYQPAYGKVRIVPYTVRLLRPRFEHP